MIEKESFQFDDFSIGRVIWLREIRLAPDLADIDAVDVRNFALDAGVSRQPQLVTVAA